MLNHIKTIISMMALCVLVASCGRKNDTVNDTAKAIKKLEEQRENILEEYKQLLSLDADQVSRELEIKEIEWKIPKYAPGENITLIFGKIMTYITQLEEEIANSSSWGINHPKSPWELDSLIPTLYCSYNKAKFKTGKLLEGLKKELEYFKLLKERYKLAIA